MDWLDTRKMSRERRWTLANSALTPVIVPVGLLLAWQLASSLGVLPSNILPAPTAVVVAAGELIADRKSVV